jgi:hypothetical protein
METPEALLRRGTGGSPGQPLDAGALRESTETGRNAAPGLEAAENGSGDENGVRGFLI